MTSYEPPHEIRHRPVVPLHAPIYDRPADPSLTRKESALGRHAGPVIRSRSATGASQRQCASIRSVCRRGRSAPAAIAPGSGRSVDGIRSTGAIPFVSPSCALKPLRRWCAGEFGAYGKEAVLDRGSAWRSRRTGRAPGSPSSGRRLRCPGSPPQVRRRLMPPGGRAWQLRPKMARASGPPKVRAAVSVTSGTGQAVGQGARVPVRRRPRMAATASRWLSREPAANISSNRTAPAPGGPGPPGRPPLVAAPATPAAEPAAGGLRPHRPAAPPAPGRPPRTPAGRTRPGTAPCCG